MKKVEDQEQKQQEVKKKEVIKVVAQLPMAPVRMEETEEEIIRYVTIEEYLSDQANAGNE